jgi:hypothetical protein
MKHFIVVGDHGEIIKSGTTNADLTDLASHYPEGQIVEVVSPVLAVNDVYWTGTAICTKPARPSSTHGFDYGTKQWMPDLAAAWQGVRDTRNQALAASDWTQLPDVPAVTKSAWAGYRQALRDITTQPDPLAIVWPAKPD